MKVKEIGGYTNGDAKFCAFYHTKIHDRDVILKRELVYQFEARKLRGIYSKLIDTITDMYYYDEYNEDDLNLKKFEQDIIKWQNEYMQDQSNRRLLYKTFSNAK